MHTFLNGRRLPGLLLMIAGLCALLAACGSDSEKVPDVSHIQVEVKIIRLEDEIQKINSREEAQQFIKKYPTFARNYLQSEDPEAAVQQLVRIAQSPYIDTLTQEVRDRFGDMSQVKKEFEQAFRYVKYYFPEFNPPPVYTIVTGFSSDVQVSDSLIVLGLDHFLFGHTRYRAPDLPQYIWRRCTPEAIVPTAMTLLSSRWIDVDIASKAMLNDMIAYGKTYLFTKKMMPGVADTLIIGYTGQEYADCLANEEIIWANFVQNDLFFEKSHLTKVKFMDERPATLEIGDKCPGRIGRWLGWQIVRKYMEEHPDIPLKAFLANKNAQQIFEQSKYKPKIRS